MKKETYNDNFIENLSRYIGETVTFLHRAEGNPDMGLQVSYLL